MSAEATFGGGCFWCTEAIFNEVAGVIDVKSGYCGGHTNNPDYEQVCSGLSGYAEVVHITFDPEIIDYSDLVRLHLVSHDPTTLNRQGADRGTQYRSVIFTHDQSQVSQARKVISEMRHQFASPIVTEIQPFTKFYAAEAYHQNYYANHPDAGYCQVIISPKLHKFRQFYADRLGKC
jgi:methionine-S-sulfoxide reductase